MKASVAAEGRALQRAEWWGEGSTRGEEAVTRAQSTQKPVGGGAAAGQGQQRLRLLARPPGRPMLLLGKLPTRAQGMPGQVLLP